MLVLIRGAGDLASGIALRLHRSGFDVVMTEIAHPTAVRRTVAFCEAIVQGEQTVEDVTAVRADCWEEALLYLEQGLIPVLIDPDCASRTQLQPAVLVDAILAKRNLGTCMSDAPVVIGVGPGFTAGQDCHAVVETMRGHTLGRVYYAGSALPDTAIPGLVGGFAGERVLRADANGAFHSVKKIGDTVRAGDVAGYVAGVPVLCQIDGVLRGLVADGVQLTKGMKSGDVDPRGQAENCYTCSDKALAIGGGVLEAILHFQRGEA